MELSLKPNSQNYQQILTILENRQNDINNALDAACFNDNYEVAKLLLGHGADNYRFLYKKYKTILIPENIIKLLIKYIDEDNKYLLNEYNNIDNKVRYIIAQSELRGTNLCADTERAMLLIKFTESIHKDDLTDVLNYILINTNTIVGVEKVMMLGANNINAGFLSACNNGNKDLINHYITKCTKLNIYLDYKTAYKNMYNRTLFANSPAFMLIEETYRKYVNNNLLNIYHGNQKE